MFLRAKAAFGGGGAFNTPSVYAFVTTELDPVRWFRWVRAIQQTVDHPCLSCFNRIISQLRGIEAIQDLDSDAGGATVELLSLQLLKESRMSI